MYRIEEVAVIIGVSTQTINSWYRWKKKNPKHELAKILPKYKQEGTKGTRFWSPSDIIKLKEFQDKLPKGRGGILQK